MCLHRMSVSVSVRSRASLGYQVCLWVCECACVYASNWCNTTINLTASLFFVHPFVRAHSRLAVKRMACILHTQVRNTTHAQCPPCIQVSCLLIAHYILFCFFIFNFNTASVRCVFFLLIVAYLCVFSSSSHLIISPYYKYVWVNRRCSSF